MKPVITLFGLLISVLTHAQTATVLWTAGDNYNAIKSALNSGAKTVYLQTGKVFDISNHIYVPSSVTFDGQGSTVRPMASFPTDTRPAVSTVIKQTKSVTGLSITVTKGSNILNYSGSGSLVNGQILIAFGGTYATYNGVDYRNGWHGGVILSHTATTATMQYPAESSFTATAIKCWQPATDVTIKNLRVDKSLTTGGYGLGAEYGVRIKIFNSIVQSDPAQKMKQGIRFVHNVDSRLENSLVDGTDLSGGEAPGYQVEGRHDTVQYCRGFRSASGISSAGRDYISDIAYLDNEFVFVGSWTGMDMHANAHGEIARNKIWMHNANNFKLHTFHVRRGETYVHDNVAYYPDGGQALLGVYMFEMGYYDNTIINNTFYYKTVAPTTVYHNYTSLSGTVVGETAYNNPAIPVSSIPAEPPVALMYPSGTTPTADTGVVVIPPVVKEPCTMCDVDINLVNFFPKQ